MSIVNENSIVSKIIYFCYLFEIVFGFWNVFKFWLLIQNHYFEVVLNQYTYAFSFYFIKYVLTQKYYFICICVAHHLKLANILYQQLKIHPRNQ